MKISFYLSYETPKKRKSFHPVHKCSTASNNRFSLLCHMFTDKFTRRDILRSPTHSLSFLRFLLRSCWEALRISWEGNLFLGVERNNEDTEYSVNRIKFRLSLLSPFLLFFSYVNNKLHRRFRDLKNQWRKFNSNVSLLFARETENKRGAKCYDLIKH